MKRKTPKHELTIEERKTLLLKPVWQYGDVMKYTGFAKSKAFEVMQECKDKLNGKVIFNDHAVKRNSVLAWLSTSFEEEINKLKQIEKLEET